VCGTRAQTQADYRPLTLSHLGVSVPDKLQMMEQEIRQLRTNFYAVSDDLQATTKELGIITDRLGWRVMKSLNTRRASSI